MITTLQAIRDKSPCEDGWKKLLQHLGKTSADNAPLPLSTVLESNGFLDALWCFCQLGDPKHVRLYAVWCARQVERLMTDQRSKDALDVAERYARGMADVEELAAARDAASAAKAAARASAWAASAAAWDAAGDAASRATAWAASATAWAASATAWAASATAWASAWDAAGDASAAAGDAAGDAAWAATWDATWDTTRAAAGAATRAAAGAAASDAQASELRRVFAELESGREPYPAPVEEAKK